MTIQHASFDLAGIVKDLPDYEVAQEYWTGGHNVVVRDGLTRRISGAQGIVSGTLGPQHLQDCRSGQLFYWLAGGATGIEVLDDAGVVHDVTPVGFSGTADLNQWSGGNLNSVPVINNGVSPPYYWDKNTANAVQALPGWIPSGTCQALRPYKYHLVAMNVFDGTDLPDQVYWSDAAQPGQLPQTWIPAPGNEAGDFQLAETIGEVIDGAQLRDDFIIYKQHSTYVMSYVGGNDVMNQRLLFAHTGALNRNCIGEVLGNHIVLTDGDVILHDGQTAQSIIDKQNRKWLFDQLDPDNFRSAFLVVNKRENEVLICFPTLGNTLCNQALAWSMDDARWTTRDIPTPSFIASGIVNVDLTNDNTWDGSTLEWDQGDTIWNSKGDAGVQDGMIACQNTGLYMHYDVGDTAGGFPIVGTVERSGLDLGDRDRMKFLRRIYPRIEASNGTALQIRAGSSPRAGQSPTYGPWRPFIVGTDEKVDVAELGRYLAVQIKSEGLQNWRSRGFELEYTVRGRF